VKVVEELKEKMEKIGSGGSGASEGDLDKLKKMVKEVQSNLNDIRTQIDVKNKDQDTKIENLQADVGQIKEDLAKLMKAL